MGQSVYVTTEYIGMTWNDTVTLPEIREVEGT